VCIAINNWSNEKVNWWGQQLKYWFHQIIRNFFNDLSFILLGRFEGKYSKHLVLAGFLLTHKALDEWKATSWFLGMLLCGRYYYFNYQYTGYWWGGSVVLWPVLWPCVSSPVLHKQSIVTITFPVTWRGHHRKDPVLLNFIIIRWHQKLIFTLYSSLNIERGAITFGPLFRYEFLWIAIVHIPRTGPRTLLSSNACLLTYEIISDW
jgi:hypothetical protein